MIHLINRIPSVKMLLSFLVVMLSVSVSHAETTFEDPWEGYNRAMFKFNDGVDTYLLKPVAKGYKEVTPREVQRGVSNFFSNLGEISNIANNLLQGKWDGTASSTFRFLINSTAGWGGIFDVASELGLKEFDEDFGQTLGYWGVSSGPYVVLPLLGPSTVRDTGGLVVDWQNYDPVDLLGMTSDEELALTAFQIVQLRASLLAAESFIIGDRYTFIRDFYLQSRDRAVKDITGSGRPKTTQPAATTNLGEEGSWGADSDVADETSDSWGEETDSWGEETDSWGEDVTQDNMI